MNSTDSITIDQLLAFPNKISMEEQGEGVNSTLIFRNLESGTNYIVYYAGSNTDTPPKNTSVYGQTFKTLNAYRIVYRYIGIIFSLMVIIVGFI